MSETPPSARLQFEQEIRSLVGRKITSVTYWTLPLPYEVDEVEEWVVQDWDYGDWHHAVVGVDLGTDDGPKCIAWTDRFYAWGVELFSGPTFDPARVWSPDGPQIAHEFTINRTSDFGALGPWSVALDSPVRGTAVHWERIELCSSRRWLRRRRRETIDIPTAIRLDFEAGPVWFVAAQLLGDRPGDELAKAFVGGDEILVVFTPEVMRALHFTDPEFG